jgi:hypothetical protein
LDPCDAAEVLVTNVTCPTVRFILQRILAQDGMFNPVRPNNARTPYLHIALTFGNPGTGPEPNAGEN